MALSINPTVRRFAHGEYVSTLHAPGTQSTDALRPEGQHGIVKRYKKNGSLNVNPQAFGWMTATYADAIEYTFQPKYSRGMGFMGGIMIGIPVISFWIFCIFSPVAIENIFIQLIFLIVAIIFFLICLLITFLCIRSELFILTDQPVIFDRKYRRVYRMFLKPPTLSSPFNLQVLVCEYQWDLIDVEHQASLGTPTMVENILTFLVKRSATDPTVIDSFSLGSGFSGEMNDCMWEHIRRFMEDGGPHLPSPHEVLTNHAPPGSLWRSLGAASFMGPGYFRRWDNNFGIMCLFHLFFFLFVPMGLLAALGNWLSYKTQLTVPWPHVVLARVGAPTQQG